jgi:hypothetical protein
MQTDITASFSPHQPFVTPHVPANTLILRATGGPTTPALSAITGAELMKTGCSLRRKSGGVGRYVGASFAIAGL